LTVRAAAATALDEIDPTMQALVDALGASAPNRRLWAVSVLTQKGPQAREAVTKLIAMVTKDEDARIRSGATMALGKIGEGKACPALSRR
jgi:HEAT repeat protein